MSGHLRIDSAAPERTDAAADYWALRDTSASRGYRDARDALLGGPGAASDFTFPTPNSFNWALEYFDTLAASRAHDVALIADDSGGRRREHTFQTLRLASDDLAVRWREQGARRGEVMLVQLPNRVELWVVLLAAIKLGLVSLPLYPDAGPADRLRALARAGAVHTATLGDPGLDVAGLQLVVNDDRSPIWPREDREARLFVPQTPTGAHEPLMSYLTSGTTGEPKLITHTHTTYPVGHLASAYWQGARRGDRHINLSEPGWAKHSWSSFFAPWIAGATVVAPPPLPRPGVDPDAAILRCLVDEGVTSMCAPVHRWRSLVEGPGAPVALTHLRETTTAGERAEPALLRRLNGLGLDLREGYGQSEATAIAGRPPGVRPEDGPGSAAVGPVLPGYRVRIVDVDDTEVSAGEPGRIVLDPVPGWPVAPGRRPEAGPYDTGDVGTLERGWLSVLGRGDDVFKREGHRVAPAAVEAVLRGAPGVVDIAVVGVPDLVGAVPHAFVEVWDLSRAGGQSAGSALLARLHQWATARLDPVQVPTTYHITPQLPRTSSGKVRRSLVRGRPTTATWVSQAASPVDPKNRLCNGLTHYQIPLAPASGPRPDKEQAMTELPELTNLAPSADEQSATNRDVLVLRDLYGPGAERLRFDTWNQPGREGAAIHELYREEPDGGHAFVVRFAPGAHGDRHAHTGYEIMVVLDGTLLNDNGDRYERGDLVLEGPESVHRVSSPVGATVLCVRQGRARGLIDQDPQSDVQQLEARP